MRNWIYIAIIILLTAGVMVVWETPPDLLLPGEDERPERRAQLYSVVTDADSRQFNDQGKLYYLFRADKLRHYRFDLERASGEDYTVIDNPRVTFLGDNKEPWQLRADSGKLTDRGTTLLLSDNVRVWQNAAGSDTVESELVTDALTIKPETKTARTDEAVRIVTPNGTVEARGMVADLDREHIELKSDVRGVYDPI